MNEAFMQTQRSLSDYPFDMMRIECAKCERRGRLSKARLIQQHGAHVGLVDLLQLIGADCPEMPRDYQNISRCGIRYGDPL